MVCVGGRAGGRVGGRVVERVGVWVWGVWVWVRLWWERLWLRVRVWVWACVCRCARAHTREGEQVSEACRVDNNEAIIVYTSLLSMTSSRSNGSCVGAPACTDSQ